MKQLLYIAGLFILCTAASCDKNMPPVDEGGAEIDMHVLSSFGDDPLILNNAMTYEDGNSFFISKFQFYISNLVLIDANGTEVQLSEVELVEFTSQDAAEAAQGYALNFDNIPEGEYTGISFGLGVSSDLNSTKPTDYGSGHPLSISNNYWTDWNSYMFIKIEGRMDTNTNGEFDKGFVYHLGSDNIADGLYKPITLSKSISIGENQILNLNLAVNLEDVLVRSNSDYINIATEASIHDAIDRMQYVVDNFENAISIE